MFDKFLKDGNFSLLKSAIENGDNCSVFGLNTGEKLALLSDSASLFYVVDSVENASAVMDKFVDIYSLMFSNVIRIYLYIFDTKT